jgi:nucleotide-binding universal stress UspA family protein
MIPLKRILFPADFSNRCRGAAHAVRVLAQRYDAEVVPIHVVPSAPGESAALLRNRACQSMTRLAQEDLEGCRVNPCITPGDPAAKIVETAEIGQFDLIMMPTHGFGTFRRFLLGSVTAKVLHDAECPVWTSVHLEDWPVLETATLKHVICAVDFGPRSRSALRCAVQSAREFDARLSIAYVVPPEVLCSGDCRLRAEDKAREKLLRIEKELGVDAEIAVLDGSPATALGEAADGLDADLLVIGRTHAAEAGALGANAYAIIAHSPCPVLSV